MIQLYGIRHHGPGSAKSLLKALQQAAPDCIVIEAPGDAESVLPSFIPPELKPPIAILMYNAKQLKQAAYIPFAEFSPEWIAIQYGLEQGIPIRFMDLPMSMNFSLDKSEQEELLLFSETEKKLSPEELAFQRDPLGAIARLAGYTDSERWWEVTFEQQDNEKAIFDSIIELMTAIRAQKKSPESRRSLQREAFMRKTLRKAAKDFNQIAVVCGAYHTPALQNLKKFPIKADNALLKGIKKIKANSTWIPWSYERLSVQSGYGAGVRSPAWYELLYNHPENVVTHWMAKVAQLLRKEDLNASSAHVIEAVRLSQALAAMRQLSVVGIEELKEAVVSIFCEGKTEPLDLIAKELIVGDKIGQVPAHLSKMPLQQDLNQQIKTARLSKYWNTTQESWLKQSKTQARGGIDLREAADLFKSHLLHRLNLLNIPWGTEGDASGRELSTFKEYWKMKWQPDFALRIIEAGMWGNTLETAANNWVEKKGIETEELGTLTELIDNALRADLTLALPVLMQRLQDLSAISNDVFKLMDALLPLVRIIRYGNVRKTNTRTVEQLVNQFIPRISIALPGACTAIDDDVADNIFLKIQSTNRAMAILNNPNHSQLWFAALEKISQLPQINGLIAGSSTRILLDQKKLAETKAAASMSFALSKGNTPLYSAQWLEGFLYGSGALLLYTQSLWNILDTWVSDLTMADFQEVVPLLRRTFANFSPNERMKILRLVERGQVALTVVEGKDFHERGAVVLPMVRLLLGM